MFGDLTSEEVWRIQEVVEAAGRPLEVVGSAARGERKGKELAGLPRKGIKSDIDYAIPPGSIHYFLAIDATNRLPGVDPKMGLVASVHSLSEGPCIRFEPGQSPKFFSAT